MADPIYLLPHCSSLIFTFRQTPHSQPGHKPCGESLNYLEVTTGQTAKSEKEDEDILIATRGQTRGYFAIFKVKVLTHIQWMFTKVAWWDMRELERVCEFNKIVNN